MDFIRAHKVWLVTIAVGLISFLEPSVNSYLAAHPHSAVAVGTFWGVAAAWARSPKN